MYQVVFHPLAANDLIEKLPTATVHHIIEKTEARLQEHSDPDGRVIKRLRHVVVTVFFEYKARADWRAIFYVDAAHREVRVLGFVPKNIGHRAFDRTLDTFFTHRYGL